MSDVKIKDFDVICHWIYNENENYNLISIDAGAKAWYQYQDSEDKIVNIKAISKIKEDGGTEKDTINFYFSSGMKGDFVLIICDSTNYNAIKFQFNDECNGDNNYFKVDKHDGSYKVIKYTGTQELNSIETKSVEYILDAESKMYYYSFAKSRYIKIRERSWEQLCTLNIFSYFIIKEKMNGFKYQLFKNIPQELHQCYASLWDDDKKEKKEKFKAYKNNCKGNSENFLQIAKEKIDYYEKFQSNLTFKCFLEHFKSKDKRECSYCGIKETQISCIKPKTKRLSTRGKTLEIDKKDAFGDYTNNNIILACYWCNNAKTDEFSEDEFKNIACGINKIWNNRLNSTHINFPWKDQVKCCK